MKRETKDVSTSESGTVVTVTYADGESFAVDTATLAEEIQRRARNWGIREKLQNAAALSKNPENGRSATLAEKKAEVSRVHEQLLNGDWSVRGEGEGSLLLQALMLAYPEKPRQVLADYLASKKAKELQALAATERVKPHLDKLRAEKGKSVDTDTMLDELDALE